MFANPRRASSGHAHIRLELCSHRLALSSGASSRLTSAGGISAFSGMAEARTSLGSYRKWGNDLANPTKDILPSPIPVHVHFVAIKQRAVHMRPLCYGPVFTGEVYGVAKPLWESS